LNVGKPDRAIVLKDKRGTPSGAGLFRQCASGARYFYWDNQPSRRPRPEQVTGEEALELAKELARGLSMTPPIVS
jgi:hypothetical protein